MASPSLTQLLAQRAELEKKISETQRAERAEAIGHVRALMTQYGLSLADIGSKSVVSPRKQGGSKVAAKYRDKATGQTWSGRGLQPNWLKAALGAGRSISEFAL